MGRHEKKDDDTAYEGGGPEPQRPLSQKGPGGKHGKPDTDDENTNEDPQK